MKREFYYQDDRSNKFWTIELTGKAYVTTNGRIGANPRETRKQFATRDEAKREAEKLIATKLKNGYLEGVAPGYEKPSWESMSMSEEVFWRIIGLFNWKKTGNDEAVLEPAVKALAQMSVGDIKRFDDLLAQKLHALDTEAHARHIGEDSYQGPDEFFSVDGFLYARCVVVVNGKKFFEQVLAKPKCFPQDMEFEAVLYLASTAYEKKTGKEYPHVPSTNYETFSNKKGWRNAKKA
jgi:predicted DNA-binding WGR domain protein